MAKKCDICGEVHEVWQAHVFRRDSGSDGEEPDNESTVKADSSSKGKPKKSVRVRADTSGRQDASVCLPCPCGCGVDVWIKVKPRFATPACRQRAKRKRDAKRS